MARQKNYDREDTVRKARDAFWEHGYQNLGVRAIEDIVGVGRFAIRTDFNGKEGLFIEALTSYREELLLNVVRPIQEADDLSVFDRILTLMTDPEGHSCSKYGCLFVNTMVENASLQNKEFQDFTALCERLELYPIDETLAIDDRLLVLSTCSYAIENGRMVIIAKKIQ